MEVRTPPLRDISSVTDDTKAGLRFMKNVSIPLKVSPLPIRANVYLPLTAEPVKFPVIATYGPYGKDIPYAHFHEKSFAEVNPEQRSKYSAWETPDPVFWTKHGYAVVRADERGTGQSPGLLDTMSSGTSECFFDVIEWCAEQSWSTGKVGLLGVSYYAGTQWRVAARRPKGLAAIIPWEGMSDYYRDRCRHGGILSNAFIDMWWNRQVLPNQYGLAGRSKLKFSSGKPGAQGQEETIEGNLPAEVLAQNRRDQTIDNTVNRFRDDEYYRSRDFRLEDIEVPLLSVANWGGICLHLRGNVEGYTHAGSKLKYLRFITGRHDLPFYYHEEVEVQRSFLDAFLKGEDRVGWSVPGKVPPVTMTLRTMNLGSNNAELERKYYPKRTEDAWPIPRTQYTKYYLTPGLKLETNNTEYYTPCQVGYPANRTLETPKGVSFVTKPFEEETEITGHITAHLNVIMGPQKPFGEKDMDLFLTLRHLDEFRDEIVYTGTAGDPVPLCKGWLRVSLRAIHDEHPRHRPWLPHREYLSTDVHKVKPHTIYGVDIEMWPTNVVVHKGQRIALDVGSNDPEESSIFQHNSKIDRSEDTFTADNYIIWDTGLENSVTLPIIPPKQETGK